MNTPLSKAYQEAIDYGIDVNLIELNLELTFEQRIEEHQRALDMINELIREYNQANGVPQKSSQNSH